MNKLVKYLKKSTISIIFIVALLIGQAICELALPDYTSSIVNVGIQQGGVENAVPEVIRKSELDKITLFISSENKDKVLENYNLLSKNSISSEEFDKYKEEYPALEKEDLYKLKTTNKETIDELSGILGKPILIVSGIENGGTEVEAYLIYNLIRLSVPY